ncbi:MAG: hypothetical protein LBR75_05060 [Prevotellaceae bacterium]|nr:hypothetical protein [Prevotellaceae bacterium]
MMVKSLTMCGLFCSFVSVTLQRYNATTLQRYNATTLQRVAIMRPPQSLVI